MSILLMARNRNMKPFKDALLKQDPNLDVEIWPNVSSKERVNFAVAWNQPDNVFVQYPNLKVISSLGAGVDHLIRDETIPGQVTLTRVVAPSLTEQMSDYVMTAIYNIIRKTHFFYQQQTAGRWKPVAAHNKSERVVGILGLGELGKRTAEDLVKAGFQVAGWSRSKKNIPGVKTYSKMEYSEFLQTTNIGVCLLPLTSDTEDILDLELFKQLRKPAYIINAGRGEHLVEEDLIYALDAGILEGAVMDVFRQEPLPESHPFWGREKMIITPHIASVTDPEEIAGLLVENYKRMLSGMELLHKVDRENEY